MTVEEEKELASDKFVMSLVSAAILGLLTWNVYTTHTLSIEVAVVSSYLAERASSFYSREAAEAAQSALSTRIDRLEQWNQNLSSRLADVENSLRGPNGD